MDPRNSSNMRKTYGDGSNKSKVEPGNRASASASVSSTSSSRPHYGDRTRSEPLVTQVSPSKTRFDARTTRASAPVSQKHHLDHAAGQATPSPKLKHPEIHFAVLGAEGSGKSTFVRCALDLKKPATSPVSSKKMSLEGDVFLISLIEVPMEEIEVVGDQIYWPDMLEDVEMPQIDGVLVVCDVTERRSVKDIPKLLAPPSSNSIPTRARATTTSHSSNSSHSHNTRIKHGRAASEITQSTGRGVTSGSLSLSSSDGQSKRDESAPDSSAASERSSMKAPLSTTSPTLSEVSENGTEDLLSPETGLASGPNIPALISKIHSRAVVRAPGADSKEYFPDVQDEDCAESKSPGHDLDRTPDEIRQSYRANAGAGTSFDDLVERLLSLPMSKSDSKFAAVFLCLYRKFAAPAQLLSGIIRRFEGLRNNSEPQLIRTSSQLRYLSILAQWIAEYPGDFAHPVTRHQMKSFISQLGNNRVFAVAAKEMGAQIELASEDDDTDWACSDTSRGRASTLQSFSSVVSMRSVVSTLLAGESTGQHSETAESVPNEEQTKNRALKHSKTSSSTSSGGRSGSQSAASFSVLFGTLESAQHQAELLTPMSRVTLTKDQWHLFMELGDEEIARELTRIDWIMYTSIRPRDLIRHVSLSAEQKEKCRSLEHVNRMINQFNHVAYWVANMILLRDKPKHRARALEKFMCIAWKLRQLNNYNSLGAITAGINGTAVHRLLQTRELVSQQAQKEFMRLEILMGTQRSHFAYRLAWENTSTERIPFLPLHRRDLVSAEEGNRTFVGEKLDRINWGKFEIMGDVIVGIQRSQGTPYPNINRNLDVQRLVLDGKFTKDDDVSIAIRLPRVLLLILDRNFMNGVFS
ncbi:hypothetical protein MMC30_003500 [Trapelia coarctata]|nr:hypothetical protein [Trapelia coarctata]